MSDQRRSEHDPTREEIRLGIATQTCPWCGAGPFLMLAGHTTRMHDVDRERLRELAGLGYTASVCDPEHARRCWERPQTEKALQAARAAPRSGHHRMSEHALQVNLRKFAAMSDDFKAQQRSRAGTAAQGPGARAKRAATMLAKNGPPEHGTQRMYRGQGCHCGACREWNRRTHADYIRRRTESAKQGEGTS